MVGVLMRYQPRLPCWTAVVGSGKVGETGSCVSSVQIEIQVLILN